MSNSKRLGLAIPLGIALLVAGAFYVQQTGAKESSGTLTTADYVEIQNLYAKYNHYVDTGKDEGRAYANLFTKDGVFYLNLQQPRVIKGYDEFVATAKGAGAAAGTLKAAHHAVNLMIEPSPEGANGAAYLFMMASPTLGTSQTGLSAVYHDQLVKTPEGWKFKVRKLDLVTPRQAPAPAKSN